MDRLGFLFAYKGPVVLAALLLLLVLERAYPVARVTGGLRRVARNLSLAGLNAVLSWAVVVPVSALAASHALEWRPEWWSGWSGLVLDIVILDGWIYWWHRANHMMPLLWRLHQVHHSPARIEVVTSFYKHPLEIAINGVLCSTVLYVLVGLPPATAATVTAITGVAELVYHWNVRTPHWLGWFFQRPEMHRRHHELGWHRSNYSDLPIWDLMFGTYDNPRETPVTCGFDGTKELQLGRMLLGRTPR